MTQQKYALGVKTYFSMHNRLGQGMAHVKGPELETAEVVKEILQSPR